MKKIKLNRTIVSILFIVAVALLVILSGRMLDVYYGARFSQQCEKLTWGEDFATFNCRY